MAQFQEYANATSDATAATRTEWCWSQCLFGLLDVPWELVDWFTHAHEILMKCKILTTHEVQQQNT